MSSHYKQIKGIKYSAPLLSAADEMVAGQGDGRISLEDAEKLFAILGKDGKYSDLEKRSLSYVRENYTFTEAGDTFLRSQIRSWAAKRGHKNSTKSTVASDAPRKGRQLTGRVISNKPAGGKTIVVEVERRVLHAKYKKIVKRRAKYHAHDEENICQINDEVVIQETRPLSKTKRWIVIEHTSSQH